MSEMAGYPGTPRWVKVLGVVAVVLVVLFGIIILTGVGGSHGPARHLSPEVGQQ